MEMIDTVIRTAYSSPLLFRSRWFFKGSLGGLSESKSFFGSFKRDKNRTKTCFFQPN
jgi:hypothetical protein